MAADDILQDVQRQIAKAERLLEVAHVAHRLRVSPQYVRRLCQTRKLPAMRLGRRWRIKPSELQRFIDDNMAA